MAGVVKNLRAVSLSGLALIRRALPNVAASAAGAAAPGCGCGSALAMGIWSDRTRIPPHEIERLRTLWGKYFANANEPQAPADDDGHPDASRSGTETSHEATS